MGQRNMRCTSQMLNLEMDQLDQHLLHPETCILLGSNSNFPHHNIHPVLSAPRNHSNIGLHHLPDHHNSGILYGTPYNGLQHHHSMENPSFGVAAASNSYNPYMIPSSGSRIFPNPGNQGSSDQLPSSSNHGIVGVGVGEYESNNHFMNGARGSFKRKNTQGFPGNYQHANSSTSSTSSSLDAPPVAGLHHWDEQSESRVGVLEIEAFTLPEYRGNDIQSVTEGGPQRSVRGRSVPISFQMGSALVHNHPHLIQRNYIGQSFRPASRALVEQQFGSNGGDGGTSTWNHVPTLPYLPGRSVSGGSLEIGNMSEQGYQETTNSRNSAVPFYPSISYHHSQQLYDHYSHHHPPPQMQGLQSHNYSYHQVPAPSYWHLMSNTLHQNVVTGPRHQRPCLPTGFRIYRPHRGVPQEAPEDGNLPRLRLLPEDEVAILDFSGFENFTDHHSDMRLDIDHMSYEELLALEERIGNVNTGLTEESIIRRLKTRTYVSHTDFNLNDPLGMDQETGTCIICQDEYKNLDNIGTLDCEHEYHAECLKKWLLIKNACPICKTSALTVESNDG